ncbi:MAG: glycosyltransferase family A protein [Patescibacteria group bacterium]|jgi:hypothetical protein
MTTPQSIFHQYYSKENFTDKFSTDSSAGVDVIIPIMHTNELWEKNLISMYREIPIHRLLVGDGGCVDNSIEIAKKFPRVTIYDHRAYTSLGYSIRKLIEETTTEWFVYLHSDVYIPEGWYNEMSKNKNRYDWFECNQRITALVEYPLDYTGVERPFSGSQMGRKEIFSSILKKIDDDFLYRNEDIILADLVKKSGYRYGRVNSTFHYHQLMYKQSQWKRRISSIDFMIEKSDEEEFRESNMQVKGIIKYLEPTKANANMIQIHISKLMSKRLLDKKTFLYWIKQTNPAWEHLIRQRLVRIAITGIIKKFYSMLPAWFR